jgi:hypothetical protein
MPEDLHGEIERLEGRIEGLAGTAENCRKFIFAGKAVIAAGALWWLLLPFGIVSFNVTAMVCTLAAVLGGIVVLGSNTTTLRQALADMNAAEQLRNELIGRTGLKIVGEEAEENSIVPWHSKTLH